MAATPPLPMRVEAVLRCPVCGGEGPVVHHGLEDRLFGAPGRWNLRGCEGCGSLWADPRPVADDLHLAYETYYTHEPSRPGPPARGEPDRRGWRDRLHEAALHLPGHGVERAGPVAYLDGFPGRVLDVGCGDGANALALERAGWDVVAIDFDEQSIDAARAAGCRDARTTTIEELDEPAQSFDAVVSIHSIEHVPDPAALLAHIRRLLKPGGVISVVTPNAASWLSARHGPDWRGLEPPRHLQILTPKALERLLSDGGYWSPRVRTTPRGTKGMVVARRLVRHELGSRWRQLLAHGEGEAYQLAETVLVRTRPELGEELVGQAVAPS